MVSLDGVAYSQEWKCWKESWKVPCCRQIASSNRQIRTHPGLLPHILQNVLPARLEGEQGSQDQTLSVQSFSKEASSGTPW